MILRALEVLEHARVHIARVYLSSPKGVQDGRTYLEATRLLDSKTEELERELCARPLDLPLHAMLKFSARSMAEN